MISGLAAPLMHPMGLGDWRITTALITGFLAKRKCSLHIIHPFGKTSILVSSITPLSAASLLVFCLLYTPCIAAIASIKRELGGKMGTGRSAFAMCHCMDRRLCGLSCWGILHVRPVIYIDKTSPVL